MYLLYNKLVLILRLLNNCGLNVFIFSYTPYSRVLVGMFPYFYHNIYFNYYCCLIKLTIIYVLIFIDNKTFNKLSNFQNVKSIYYT